MNISKQVFHFERGDLKFEGNNNAITENARINRIKRISQIDKIGELKDFIENQLN